ncbi:hypothetical protein ACH5RR_040593 [Cinchona calisaya]|uniref:CTLH domain-containing protein n=1 Tax=Cinchona calisaya TaxID=153742 RepID=A0ABD2XTW3_9GENT
MQFLIIKEFHIQENRLCYRGTVHNLEKESGLFFDTNYFEESVKCGDWDDLEYYLSGLTKVREDDYSTDIFFLIQKQKYYGALADENKEHNGLGDIKSSRTPLLNTVKELIKKNPLFLHLPIPRRTTQPELESAPMYLLYSGAMFYPMFVAHQTAPGGPISPYLSGRMVHPSSVEHQSVPGGLIDPFLSGGMLYSPFVAHQTAPAVPMPLYLSGVMGYSSFEVRQTVPGGPMPLPYSGSSVPMPIRPKAPTSDPALNYQTAASEHVSNRLRLLGTSHQSPMTIPIDVASSSNVGPVTGVADRNTPATANVTQLTEEPPFWP